MSEWHDDLLWNPTQYYLSDLQKYLETITNKKREYIVQMYLCDDNNKTNMSLTQKQCLPTGIARSQIICVEIVPDVNNFILS